MKLLSALLVVLVAAGCGGNDNGGNAGGVGSGGQNGTTEMAGNWTINIAIQGQSPGTLQATLVKDSYRQNSGGGEECAFFTPGGVLEDTCNLAYSAQSQEFGYPPSLPTGTILGTFGGTSNGLACSYTAEGIMVLVNEDPVLMSDPTVSFYLFGTNPLCLTEYIRGVGGLTKPGQFSGTFSCFVPPMEDGPSCSGTFTGIRQ